VRVGLATLLVAVFAGDGALAHDSDYSYLRLRIGESRIGGEWEIHQRDARIALGLSGDVAGERAWVELRAREPALRALLAERLALSIPAGVCEPVFAEGFREMPDERDYAVLSFAAGCPGEIESLRIGYTLLFDLDTAHRGFFTAEDAHQTHVGVFHAEQRELTLTVRQLDLRRQLLDYLREGAWHIWLGPDHLLFLLALLLPASLRLGAEGWEPREQPGDVVREVAKIVIAFALAHSLTLTLAAVGVVRLPSRWVEASIAVSVLAVAWNNLRPFLPGRGAALAFGFGLVHGLGFAGALAQLGLPRQTRGLSLLAFNVGVEFGQLAVVAALLPAIYAARRTRSYRRVAVGAASLGIAWIAAIWLIERLFGLELVPVL
jgi:hypothetical protein